MLHINFTVTVISPSRSLISWLRLLIFSVYPTISVHTVLKTLRHIYMFMLYQDIRFHLPMITGTWNPLSRIVQDANKCTPYAQSDVFVFFSNFLHHFLILWQPKEIIFPMESIWEGIMFPLSSGYSDCGLLSCSIRIISTFRFGVSRT